MPEPPGAAEPPWDEQPGRLRVVFPAPDDSGAKAAAWLFLVITAVLAIVWAVVVVAIAVDGANVPVVTGIGLAGE